MIDQFRKEDQLIFILTKKLEHVNDLGKVERLDVVITCYQMKNLLIA